MLRFQIFHLAEAHTMLARARAAHRQGTHHHAVVQHARVFELRSVVGIEDVNQMEVPVARVPDEADRERRPVVVGPGVDDAVRKP